MPRTSRPCSHVPGDHGDPHRCPNLTRHTSGLCEEKHLKLQRARVDATRTTAHRRGYDRAHRTDRARAVAAGQTCAIDGCERTDIHRDHIDGNPRNNHPDNIQWLCTTHHSSKTLTHDVERDDRGRILPKPRKPRPTGKIRSVGT